MSPGSCGSVRRRREWPLTRPASGLYNRQLPAKTDLRAPAHPSFRLGERLVREEECDGASIDAEGDRGLAGREHHADLPADRRVLRAARARGERHRRRRGGAGHQGVRPDRQPPADRRGDHGAARPTRRTGCGSTHNPAADGEAKRKGPRYTPLSKRQDRPAAIAWLVKFHPELTDGQIAKLVGTTKPTIQSIRDRSHWNIANVTPVDPVALGLCKQGELDAAVAKAVRKNAAEGGVMSDAERMKLVSTEQSLTMEPEPRLPSAISGLENFTLGGGRKEERLSPRGGQGRRREPVQPRAGRRRGRVRLVRKRWRGGPLRSRHAARRFQKKRAGQSQPRLLKTQ